MEEGAGVVELSFVSDGAREFDGEAEVGRRGDGPALPGFAHVGAVKAGVDFYAMEEVGVALEVGEVGVSGWGKGVGVVLGERPAGGADVDVVEWGRVGGGGFHTGARVGVWRLRRILRRVPQPAVRWLGCRAKGVAMETNLQGKRVAILATNGFEQSELLEPKKNLEDAGATVTVLSLKTGEIKGWNHTDWGKSVKVDGLVKDAKPDQFDALVLPGGQMNPDVLRTDSSAVTFVRTFVDSGKTVAAICHAPWLLIESDVVRGKTMTSWPSVRTDLKNAGAHWVDEPVIVDGNLITSRKPDDIPAFSQAIAEALTANKLVAA